MLQYQSVYPQTLELLKQIMCINEFKDFYLVGGTALALQLGHRISVDLDFFTQKDFSSEKLISELENKFSIADFYTETNTLSLNIIFPPNSDNVIKVDFMKYNYPLLKPLINENNLRLASLEDITAMKLSAIANRGSKKDFYDLFFLLQKFSLLEMVEMFKQKFNLNNLFHLIKSLIYFDDAELEPNPILIRPVEWEKVKDTITTATKNYLKNK